MKKFLVVSLCMASSILFAQKQELRRVATVGFYNVENLFDTIVSADYIDGSLDPQNPAFHRSIPIDSIPLLEHQEYKGPWSDAALKGKKVIRNQRYNEEFTPKSNKHYGSKIYHQKLHNMAQVISELGRKYTHTAPAVVGLAEVENRQVVEALIHQPQLAKYNYGFVHYNSYDERGIDVALIYQKSRFKLIKSWKKQLVIFDNGYRDYTRDILVVLGELDGEKFAFFVNHWPSRRGGEVASQPRRNAAATLLKQQMDSVRSLNQGYKLIAMGDFNDDPVSPSITDYLKATGKARKVGKEHPYYNPMTKLYKHGIATLAYRDAPNLFDQLIISENLMKNNKRGAEKSYHVALVKVYAPRYLFQREGNYKGYPLRSWDGDSYTNGYSDHLPSYLILEKSVTR